MTRRLCSVWSNDEGLYLYFAVPVLVSGESRHRRLSLSLRPPLGDPLELLLRSLPAGALYVGRGPLARGEIVNPRRVGGGS
jgi:hypothetical protein